ncbi:hypothetical protein L1276_004643 [Flavobacterium sp. HSC-32F16]|nr:hypothetical protein [Flavobacterium sp. HSC-32F16]
MGTASFCGGVHHKRYSGLQESAPEKNLSLFKTLKRHLHEYSS